jgi:hypothetical protein
MVSAPRKVIGDELLKGGTFVFEFCPPVWTNDVFAHEGYVDVNTSNSYLLTAFPS